jgi:predicted polyphosphate/ATP-dependent NAD kinase
MGVIGILANPDSGKDVRRLVAHAYGFGNSLKSNTITQILAGINSTGNAHNIYLFPDLSGISSQSRKSFLQRHVDSKLILDFLDMQVEGNAEDTARALDLLIDLGADCLILLGGDGTVRQASKNSKDLPLLPVSMGTNNIMPQSINGTVVGMTAAVFSSLDDEEKSAYCYRSKRIEIWIDNEFDDQALVDAAVLTGRFAGTKAVWTDHEIQHLIVTQASPLSVGLTSIVGMVVSIDRKAPVAAYLKFGPGGRVIRAPIAPGEFKEVSVIDTRLLAPGESVEIVHEKSILLALDGEREITVKPDQQCVVRFSQDGPMIVDAEKVMLSSLREEFFTRDWSSHAN